MHLARTTLILQLPKVWVKSLILSMAVVSVVVVSGCASKPQVMNSKRFIQAPEFYTVKSGDTLSAIASKYGLSYISVAQLNDISPPYKIYVNQSLRLKSNGNIAKSTVKPLATNVVEQTIQRQTVPLPTNQTITKVQQTTTDKTITTQPIVTNPTSNLITGKSASLRWVKPSNGPVLENYNLNTNIKGIRYGGNIGDDVFAAADGQVVYAADGLKEYGNLVLIKHINGFITAYAHNSKIIVKSGENVVAGAKIAELGSSGTTRAMLEFQVRLDGKPINPTNILPNN